MEHKPKARAGIPMTDGTPAPCRQKNAASFLAGDTPGVMASYGHGGRGPRGPIPPPGSGDAGRAPRDRRGGGPTLAPPPAVKIFEKIARNRCNPAPLPLLW